MIIWLLRHGEAEQASGSRDADRPLSPVGQRQSQLVGSFLCQVHPPDVILTSPYLRAKQTASIVAAACGSRAPDDTKALLSDAEPAEVVREVVAHKANVVLLVGHEPLMSSLASYLTSNGVSSAVRMSPCTLALVRMRGAPRPGSGSLELLIPPDVHERKPSSSSEKKR